MTSRGYFGCRPEKKPYPYLFQAMDEGKNQIIRPCMRNVLFRRSLSRQCFIMPTLVPTIISRIHAADIRLVWIQTWLRHDGKMKVKRGKQGRGSRVGPGKGGSAKVPRHGYGGGSERWRGGIMVILHSSEERNLTARVSAHGNLTTSVEEVLHIHHPSPLPSYPKLLPLPDNSPNPSTPFPTPTPMLPRPRISPPRPPRPRISPPASTPPTPPTPPKPPPPPPHPPPRHPPSPRPPPSPAAPPAPLCCWTRPPPPSSWGRQHQH